MEATRWVTPTGEPCPRCVRVDGTVEGGGHCTGCGCCLQLAVAAWPDEVDELPSGSTPDHRRHSS